MKNQNHFNEVASMVNSSEEYRHACEVRYVLELRKKSKEDKDRFLRQVREARGNEAADKLHWSCVEEWKKLFQKK